MLKRIMLVSLVSVCLLVIFRSESKAQYNYFGGGWEFCFLDENFNFVCSYHHKMTFTGVKGGDFKNFDIFFLSKSVWYDNVQICQNKGGNNAFEPGQGHVLLGGRVEIDLADACNKQGKCTGEVVYPNTVADLNNPDLFALFCQAGETPLRCFSRLFGDPHCRNKNDTVVEIRTKGVCATATAQTCEIDNPTNCTDKREVGLRYTFPSFTPNPGDSFAQQRDDRCIACVNGTGPCEP